MMLTVTTLIQHQRWVGGWRMEHRSSDSDEGKSKYSEKNLVPVPLSPSKITHGVAWG